MYLAGAEFPKTQFAVLGASFFLGACVLWSSDPHSES